MAEDSCNAVSANPPTREESPVPVDISPDGGESPFQPAENPNEPKRAGSEAGAPKPARSQAKRFWILAGIALAMLAGYNVLIGFASRTTQRYRMLQAIRHLPPGTDCILLGNSLMAAGGDLRAFKSAWRDPNAPPAPVNLALGATTPVEHYLILKHALEQPVHIKYLVYGFFDDQMNAPVSGGWTNLMGNRAFSCYFPKDAAAFYAPGSRWEVWKLWLIGHIPMFADRSSFWGRVELLRRWCGRLGMPQQKYDRFGRAADFAELEPRDVASFTERCESVVREHKGFSPAMRGIFQLAHEHHIQVILVEMPMPSSHRQEFYSLPAWADLRNYLQRLAAREKAVYLSASDWVPEDRDFMDAMHLNEQGAKVFSRRLAVAMAGLEGRQLRTARVSFSASSTR